MADDVPDEDILHIQLLDKSLNIIDAATIGGVCFTGTSTKYKVQELNKMTFNFIDGSEW